MAKFHYNTEEEARQAYIDMLNEVYQVTLSNVDGEVPNFMLAEGRSPAEMMAKNDPIMFRCGFNDYMDSIVQDGMAPDEAYEWSVDPSDKDTPYHQFNWEGA